MFSAIDFVSANDMLAITATTSPRSGNVMRYVVPPMNSSCCHGPTNRGYAHDELGEKKDSRDAARARVNCTVSLFGRFVRD